MCHFQLKSFSDLIVVCNITILKIIIIIYLFIFGILHGLWSSVTRVGVLNTWNHWE